jgi:hypothetical protein
MAVGAVRIPDHRHLRAGDHAVAAKPAVLIQSAMSPR